MVQLRYGYEHVEVAVVISSVPQSCLGGDGFCSKLPTRRRKRKRNTSFAEHRIAYNKADVNYPPSSIQPLRNSVWRLTRLSISVWERRRSTGLMAITQTLCCPPPPSCSLVSLDVRHVYLPCCVECVSVFHDGGQYEAIR